jgi:hypothetical protein
MRWRITDDFCRHYIMGRIEDARGTVKVMLRVREMLSQHLDCGQSDTRDKGKACAG